MLIPDQVNAANRLEELAMVSKDIVRLLRSGQSSNKAYALLFLFRSEVTKTLRLLDVAIIDGKAKQFAQDVIDSETLDAQTFSTKSM